jgi:HD superfamily phosphodiesterase
MQELKQRILEAEEVWLLLLLNHCNKLFSEVFLPSHDHLHHYRVWSHAKDLMLMLEESGCRISPELPLQLILAAFFHDTGLIRTHDEKHGLESRRLCEDFFRSGDHPVPERFPEILDAIEHHDDKSYWGRSIHSEPERQVLRLLSTSDDLDAFGYTGIYRYAEIYLCRDIHPTELPRMIVENLNNRFNNLKNSLVALPHYIDRQEIRYWITREFYLALAEANAAESERSDWKRELIRVFQDGIHRRENLLKRERILPELEHHKEIQQFFMLIDEENSISTPT